MSLYILGHKRIGYYRIYLLRYPVSRIVLGARRAEYDVTRLSQYNSLHCSNTALLRHLNF